MTDPDDEADRLRLEAAVGATCEDDDRSLALIRRALPWIVALPRADQGDCARELTDAVRAGRPR